MSSRASRIVFALWLAIFFLSLLGGALPAQQNPALAAGQNPDLPQLYARGMSEFQSGDYSQAAVDLEALFAKAEFAPELEPAFFTLPIFKLAPSEVPHPVGEAPVFAKQGPVWKAEKANDETATAGR